MSEQPPQIALGADHKGFQLKEQLKKHLQARGYKIIDFGTDSDQSDDYPDFGLKVAHAVADGRARVGINICWTGNGMNIAANKVRTIRSALCLSVEMAQLAREHNNANVLALASKFISSEEAFQIVEMFLTAKYQAGRHELRLKKIEEEERKV